uniref:Uncharacterized protein n=1 Tax=Arundo donax TaxID=35708 RepID=A0A0A9BX25_ARUDO
MVNELSSSLHRSSSSLTSQDTVVWKLGLSLVKPRLAYQVYITNFTRVELMLKLYTKHS